MADGFGALANMQRPGLKATALLLGQPQPIEAHLAHDRLIPHNGCSPIAAPFMQQLAVLFHDHSPAIAPVSVHCLHSHRAVSQQGFAAGRAQRAGKVSCSRLPL
ncbi:hypothetical protein D9M70_632920 [compost metagenome]